MRGFPFAVVVGAALGFSAACAAQNWGVRPDGQPLAALAPQHTRAVALFFVASDCPVSNRAFPEMRRLREKFDHQGVQVWYVYPNQGEKPADVLAHQKDYDANGSVLLDPAGALVRLAHAVATPELVVLVPAEGHGWRPVYAGRVDNRYVRLGLERPAATQFYGDETLTAVLAGRQPAPAVGSPVGCAIMNTNAHTVQP